jgi:hypothetical protein
MTNATSEKKRNRRSVAQLLKDYRAMLDAFDATVAVRRDKLLSKIERIEARHSLMVLALETLGDKSTEQAAADLDAQMEQLRLRRKALKHLTKSA